MKVLLFALLGAILATTSVCKVPYKGDSYLDSSSRPECVLNSDCDRNLACIRKKCKDPCPGTCGQNAVCNVINHVPMCEEPEIVNPCMPNPCGHNSQCREINNHAVCSCVLGFVGSPPRCRLECNINSECSSNEACFNQKCIDPCPGTCPGFECKVINHNPICNEN